MNVHGSRPLAAALVPLGPASAIILPSAGNQSRGAAYGAAGTLTQLPLNGGDDRFETDTLRELGRKIFTKLSNLFSAPESEQLINRLNAVLGRAADRAEEAGTGGVFSINNLMQLNTNGSAALHGTPAFSQILDGAWARLADSLNVTGIEGLRMDNQKPALGANPAFTEIASPILPQKSNEPGEIAPYKAPQLNPRFADVRRRPYEAPVQPSISRKNTLSSLLSKSPLQRLFSSLKSVVERRRNR